MKPRHLVLLFALPALAVVVYRRFFNIGELTGVGIVLAADRNAAGQIDLRHCRPDKRHGGRRENDRAGRAVQQGPVSH